MTTIHAYAALQPGTPLQPFTYEPGELQPDQVEIAVSYCGICHSDLSMINNDWGNAIYPLVPGHEIVGEIVAVGDQVHHLIIGQKVGLGWFSGSCMTCLPCLSGHHNLCVAHEQTIVQRHGGFADRVRCHWVWAIPLPPALEMAKAGPLFCGGITVFNPLLQFNVKPTDRVGVIGIGGLGHLAVQFLHKWGCEVFAFSSSTTKRSELLNLGAHHVIDSNASQQLAALKGKLHFIIATVNVPLNWSLYLDCLAPQGRLHIVGAVLEPLPIHAFALITGQKSLSGTPLGSPATTATMLEFCARHGIAPVIEVFPLSQVNEALAHLAAGKARYRVVLKNDLS